MDNNIKGFEWYLPLTYKDSVAQCKFEQGDVIYRHRPLGTIWGEEINHIDFLIQVKSPTRTNTSAAGDLNVFDTNWNSRIVFEKIYPNNFGQNETIETTQGKFYSYLWKNDESILKNEVLTPPVLTSISVKHINSDFIKSKISPGWIGFAIIVDSVSNLNISKRNSINAALAEKYDFRTELYDLNEAVNIKTIDTRSFSGICPTLGVELFLIQSDNIEEIEEILKVVLFKGNKNRFNINIHGKLFKKQNANKY